MRTVPLVATIVLVSALLTGCTTVADTNSRGTAQPPADSVPTPEPEPLPVVDGCVWTPEVLQALLAPWLAPGAVTITSSGGGECGYDLPAGSFPEAIEEGYLEQNGVPSVIVRAHAYSEGQYYQSHTFDVSREFGGYTAEEVYQSALIATVDVNNARTEAQRGVVTDLPDVGQGSVAEWWGAIVTGADIWYNLDVSLYRVGPHTADAVLVLAQDLGTK